MTIEKAGFTKYIESQPQAQELYYWTKSVKRRDKMNDAK